jgi:hypothetical protein
MIRIGNRSASLAEIAGLLAELDALAASGAADMQRDETRALLRACLRMRGVS